MDEMDEIIKEFLVESNDNLDQLDRDLVELEKDLDSSELLGRIFRAIHTVKGTSGVLGFGKLESVAHVGENLLSRMRDRKLRLNAEITTGLLAMVDALREVLRKVIIPDLLRSRAAEKTLRIWSAACSSGQEPYSLAMLLREHFPELRTWNVQVLATDISTFVLDRARAGRYSQLEINRGLPISMLPRYFHREGMDWVISQEIRNSVQLVQLNLAEIWPAIPLMDVILLRNVLIYFEVEVKKEILSLVRHQLCPDGYMLMGGAETTLNLDDSFERVQYETTAFYRRRI